jgi:hypothetical protein
VFVVSTLVGIGLQVPITTWCRARWASGTGVAVGLAVMGLSFLPVAVSAPLLPTRPELGAPVEAIAAGLPVLVATVLFTVGMSVANPFTMALLPVLGSRSIRGRGGPDRAEHRSRCPRRTCSTVTCASPAHADHPA